MFRPEGWDETKEECRINASQNDLERDEIFELGADAMLGVLQNSGLYVGQGEVINDPHGLGSARAVNDAGWMVFIPEGN